MACTVVGSSREAHHIHNVSHGEDEDSCHSPGVTSPAGMVDPRRERHKLLGKDLTQKSAVNSILFNQFAY